VSRDPRRVRRRRSNPIRVDSSKVELPGPLRAMTDRKVLLVLGAVMVVGMVVGLLPGVIGLSTAINDQGLPRQANELPDAPQATPADASGTPADASGTPAPAPTPRETVRRYDEAPALTIDPSRTYTATIRTDKGDLSIELYAEDAPQAVNSFVFLAREGYYNGNPVILGANSDGSAFAAAIGDPTGTGNVRPGFSLPREVTSHPFVKGAIGMGDAQTATNDGRFWISFANAPALDGKYTIFGRVASGLDVLEALTSGSARVLSVVVDES